MKQFEINKLKLDKNFTSVNTEALGQATGELKHCGLKLYLYLNGNRDGFKWTLNPAAYASWLGMDYASKGRTVRKAIDDGIADLIENGYLEVVNAEEELYRFSEQKVPKIEDQTFSEQKVPKKAEFIF